jgi:hypothetical protein
MPVQTKHLLYNQHITAEVIQNQPKPSARHCSQPHGWRSKEEDCRDKAPRPYQGNEEDNTEEHSPDTHQVKTTLESTLSPPPPHAILLLPRPFVHDIRDPCPAQALECLNQLVRLVELLHIVSASDALALHQDVRHRAAAGHLGERVLQLCA